MVASVARATRTFGFSRKVARLADQKPDSTILPIERPLSGAA
jgi:hypothetical protein